MDCIIKEKSIFVKRNGRFSSENLNLHKILKNSTLTGLKIMQWFVTTLELVDKMVNKNWAKFEIHRIYISSTYSIIRKPHWLEKKIKAQGHMKVSTWIQCPTARMELWWKNGSLRYFILNLLMEFVRRNLSMEFHRQFFILKIDRLLMLKHDLNAQLISAIISECNKAQ